MTAKIQLIINPASAGGKTGRHQQTIIRRVRFFFGESIDVFTTTTAGEATKRAALAANQKAELIIVAGGDGTIQEVINGLFRDKQPLNPDIRLGIINCGTGGGLADSLNLPGDLDGQISVIKKGRTSALDCGFLSYTADGQRHQRYFINELQCGIGGTVVKKLSHKGKKLGGFLGFGLTALRSIFTHANQRLSITINKDHQYDSDFVGVLIANGAFTGGGMQLAPGACLDDGLFNILLIHGQSVLSRLISFSQVYSGRHIFRNKFSYFQANKLHIAAWEPVNVEADGELLGNAPLDIELIHNAIHVCVP